MIKTIGFLVDFVLAVFLGITLSLGLIIGLQAIEWIGKAMGLK